MDTDDLRIRRWGEIGDGYLGPAFHMRFKPGPSAVRLAPDLSAQGGGRGFRGHHCEHDVRARAERREHAVAGAAAVHHADRRVQSALGARVERVGESRTSTSRTSRGSSSPCRRSRSSGESPVRLVALQAHVEGLRSWRRDRKRCTFRAERVLQAPPRVERSRWAVWPGFMPAGRRRGPTRAIWEEHFPGQAPRT